MIYPQKFLGKKTNSQWE